MKVEFNLSPGDTVWLMDDNQVKCGKIVSTSYVKSVSCVDFDTVYESKRYDVDVDGGKVIKGCYDEQLFPSKEDLIKSL